MNGQPPLLIRAQDVPRTYGFTPRQVRRWVAVKRLPYFKPSGPKGPTYFERADLDQLLAASRVPAAEPEEAG